jgi:hypothetical protein
MMNRIKILSFSLFIFWVNIVFADFQLGVDQGLNMSLFTDNFGKGYYLAPKIEGGDWGLQYSYNKQITNDDRNLHTFDIYLKEKRSRHGSQPYIVYGAGYGFYDLVETNIHGGHGLITLGVDYPIQNMGIVLGTFVKYNGMLSKSEEKIVSGKDILYHQFLSLGFTISLGE